MIFDSFQQCTLSQMTARDHLHLLYTLLSWGHFHSTALTGTLIFDKKVHVWKAVYNLSKIKEQS